MTILTRADYWIAAVTFVIVVCCVLLAFCADVLAAECLHSPSEVRAAHPGAWPRIHRGCWHAGSERPHKRETSPPVQPQITFPPLPRERPLLVTKSQGEALIDAIGLRPKDRAAAPLIALRRLNETFDEPEFAGVFEERIR